MIDERQLPLLQSPLCGGCPAACWASGTALQCSPDYVPPRGIPPIVVHRNTPDLVGRFAEINGFDLDIAARPQNIPILPPYTPHLRPWKRITSLDGIRAVSVPLRAVEGLATRVQSTGRSAKALLRLSAEQLLLVAGFEHDNLLEAAWPPPPRRRRLLAAIEVLQPDAAVAWGYSAWYENPRGTPTPWVERRYNIKRSLIIYAHLQDYGIPAIPHVYWGSRRDLRDWASWLEQNPCVGIIAIDLQTTDSPAAWTEAIRGVRALRELVHPDVTCLFSGICHVDRIRTIRRVWSKSAFCNFGPFFCVAFPEKTLFGLPPLPGHRAGLSYTEIFCDRVKQYTSVVTDCIGSSCTRASTWGPPLLPTDLARARRRLLEQLDIGQVSIWSPIDLDDPQTADGEAPRW